MAENSRSDLWSSALPAMSQFHANSCSHTLSQWWAEGLQAKCGVREFCQEGYEGYGFEGGCYAWRNIIGSPTRVRHTMCVWDHGR